MHPKWRTQGALWFGWSKQPCIVHCQSALCCLGAINWNKTNFTGGNHSFTWSRFFGHKSAKLTSLFAWSRKQSCQNQMKQREGTQLTLSRRAWAPNVEGEISAQNRLMTLSPLQVILTRKRLSQRKLSFNTPCDPSFLGSHMTKRRMQCFALIHWGTQHFLKKRTSGSHSYYIWQITKLQLKYLNNKWVCDMRLSWWQSRTRDSCYGGSSGRKRTSSNLHAIVTKRVSEEEQAAASEGVIEFGKKKKKGTACIKALISDAHINLSSSVCNPEIFMLQVWCPIVFESSGHRV